MIIITALVKSPKPMDSKAAAISNIVIGLLNCRKKSKTGEELEVLLKVLYPYCFKRLTASAFDNPFSEQDRFFKASSILRFQKFSNELGRGAICIFLQFTVT